MLSKYKIIQATKLSEKLKIYHNLSLKKYGSIDNVPKGNFYVIDNQNDIDIVQKLIDSKSYILEYKSNNKGITHVYSIGMWYYYGLPDIMISFENEINENSEFIDILFSIIHESLFDKFENVLLNDYPENDDDILIKHDYCKDINLNINKFDTNLILKRIDEDNYFRIDCEYAIWFDIYFSKTNKVSIDDDVVDNYPIYRLDITTEEYDSFCMKILNSLNKYLDAMKTNIINDNYIIKNSNNSLESIHETDDSSDSSLDDLSDDFSDNLNLENNKTRFNKLN
jgi:hypothetical protein